MTVYRAEATFDNCSFDDNESPTGSGIYAEDAVVLVKNSYFQNNAGVVSLSVVYIRILIKDARIQY